jgi:hypothetical protein
LESEKQKRENFVEIRNFDKTTSHQHTLQRIWAIGLMENWFCTWDDLANPKNRLNLVPNPL